METAVFVKGEKALYAPKAEPALLEVPPMRFFMADGVGDPNEAGGAFQQAVSLLYGLAYTVRMSAKGGQAPQGYFEYTVAPLEGLWSMADNEPGVDFARKHRFAWTVMIRQPAFVTDTVFAWAQAELARKKKRDTAGARLAEYAEGLCVQCMHIGPYATEPATVARMEAYMAAHGLAPDYASRRHHELYVQDPARVAPEKLKTILRIPVRNLPRA